MPLRATITTTDQLRMTRLLIAWHDGDKLACDVVLEEVMADPLGTPGILFALCTFTHNLGRQVAPDWHERLQARLLDQAGADEGDGGAA